MASFSLLPDAQSGTNQWAASTGTDFVDIVDEDDDSTYIHQTRAGREINYTFANPTAAQVASIDFDEDVTVSIFVNAHHTGTGTATLDLDTQGVGITLATVTVAVANDDSFPTYAGSNTTIKSFGTAWDAGGLNALSLELKCQTNTARFQYLRVSYIYIVVSYTAVVTDNAVFFGANF